MSARPRGAERAARNTKLAGAGVAGLTAVFAVAPFAHAAPAKPTPSDSNAPASAGRAPAAHPRTAADEKPAIAPTPNYGTHKIRVGVQIKAGADVPAGTQTGGTAVTFHETGPNAGNVPITYHSPCHTDPQVNDAPGGTETFCQFNNLPLVRRADAATKAKISAARAKPAAAPSFLTDYAAQPGDTVTFTQTTVNDNLVIDSVTQTVGPCLQPVNNVAAAVDVPPCPSFGDATPVTFNDPGKPPIARDDSRTTGPGQAVTIKVLDNDSLQGAKNVTGVAKSSDPKHGTAKVMGKPGPAGGPEPTIVYTPAAGFAGVDSFTYTLSTANGSSTATVTVTVPAPPSSAPPSSDTGNKNLANTGTDSMALLDLGVVLIVVGAGATVIGRRRRVAARHARIG